MHTSSSGIFPGILRPQGITQGHGTKLRNTHVMRVFGFGFGDEFQPSTVDADEESLVSSGV